MNQVSLYAIPLLILLIVGYAFIKKVKVYEVFIEGAKEGLKASMSILPFLVCMLCAIGMFRGSGAMNWLIALMSPVTSLIGLPVEVLPMGIMRSFSGGGAQGLMVDLLNTYGADSLIGMTASIAMGSTETTFYCIALYYGCVGITKVRHTIAVGLAADVVSLITAAFIATLIFT